MRSPRGDAVSTVAAPPARRAPGVFARNALHHGARLFRPARDSVKMRAMSAQAAVPTARDSKRNPLRALDDLVFRAESGLLSFALIATTVMVFLDVAYRRLVAPDSKVGAILAAIAGITEPAARAALR